MELKNSLFFGIFWFVVLFSDSFAASKKDVYDLNISGELERMAKNISGYKYVLLGEKHDNQSHHILRGKLLELFGKSGGLVVAEHIPYPATVDFSNGVIIGLEAAGFNKNGWRWPIHEPLFAAISKNGYRLCGGNLDDNTSKEIGKHGLTKVPKALLQQIEGAALTQGAKEALKKDLIDGRTAGI